VFNVTPKVKRYRNNPNYAGYITDIGERSRANGGDFVEYANGDVAKRYDVSPRTVSDWRRRCEDERRISNQWGTKKTSPTAILRTAALRLTTKP
jgi:hypothetical protein